MTVRAGGNSLPAMLTSNITHGFPGRCNGFPVASFQVTSHESEFVIDFSAWSNNSVYEMLGSTYLVHSSYLSWSGVSEKSVMSVRKARCR